MTTYQVKCIYESADPSDGYRVLVLYRFAAVV